MARKRFLNPDVESFWRALEENLPHFIPLPILLTVIALGFSYQMGWLGK